ncbi:phosphate ABC transporter substrate-binding protein [Paraglaciecola sp.]|uniref:phosphate ABC transporter substrate-binding protein n=1 Tax=Paraglaciecola sp. TaxID=1920173 RepID=UPI0030F48F6C
MHVKTLRTGLISAFMGCSMSFVANAELVLVVHPTNDASIDAKAAQRIFLGKESKFSNGKEAIPINQAPDSPNRSSFDSDTLGRSSTQVAAYWSKLVFTGKGIPPKEVGTDSEVIAMVADNQNAIGYVDSASVTGAVKAIPLN